MKAVILKHVIFGVCSCLHSSYSNTLGLGFSFVLELCFMVFQTIISNMKTIALLEFCYRCLLLQIEYVYHIVFYVLVLSLLQECKNVFNEKSKDGIHKNLFYLYLVAKIYLFVH